MPNPIKEMRYKEETARSEEGFFAGRDEGKFDTRITNFPQDL